MATAKPKGLKGLLGKQVFIKHRYGGEKEEGPFTLLSIDLPFLEFRDPVLGMFWWNSDLIEGLKEVAECKQADILP